MGRFRWLLALLSLALGGLGALLETQYHVGEGALLVMLGISGASVFSRASLPELVGTDEGLRPAPEGP